MHYVLDEKGNKVESLSKEEILAVMQQAIDNGNLENIDAGSAFVSKLKCCVGGNTFGMAFVTQAKYNELKTNGQLIEDSLYFITDDTTAGNIEENIDAFNKELKGFEETIAGYQKELDERVKITNKNGVLYFGNIIIPQKKKIYEQDVTVNFEEAVQLAMNESINNGDLIEVHCSVKVFADYTSLTGKFYLDSSHYGKLFLPLFDTATNSKSMGMLEISFTNSSGKLGVHVSTQSFANSGGTPPIATSKEDMGTAVKVIIKKVYKVIE